MWSRCSSSSSAQIVRAASISAGRAADEGLGARRRSGADRAKVVTIEVARELAAAALRV